MWREARLAFTDSLAALDCSVVPAHPWIHGLGQQTDNWAGMMQAMVIQGFKIHGRQLQMKKDTGMIITEIK
ncbi:hypothetical protein IAS44_001549 [Salmonella enterica subsp. enterica serovar Anatum]|uniref:Uncharacterized protein n=11 Tax=Salmonella enterica TaxID=28901 RepID=A0A2T8MCP6_SALAN|nr:MULTISPECIES: hypothetical protein [Salmonella]EAA1856562.1 hypothetical protein [Salmonella enterica subsp. enterica serovar Chester]EAA5431672.1 hypothetical protein [Salmonella enterica subsp. enterica serovar Falkensee]EAA7213626.1 hypothetical protein [Salmonella enterica subsp. enterica serovar Typhimurium]EAP2051928.1 hypothetical protein [Salmonella enterica subsp. enterica serovar 4,[5],12:i:-]EAP5757163.1 hypothetical protein [Salmonella enterica subsp. enterica serovar Barranquil